MIPEAAVEAAAREVFERHGRKYYSGIGSWEDLDHKFRTAWLEDARLALEAAAPHMLGYRWPVGDDDNPHRDGDVQPRRHWLVNSDRGWECSGCDWTGAILKDYWTVHEKLDEYQVPF